MTSHEGRKVHFVGSIPLADAGEVFEQVGARVGEAAHAIPDGETGERRGWIRWFRQRLAETGNFERVRETELRVRPDVAISAIEFGPLGYVEEARKSYALFTRARRDGKIPPDVRLQVSIPTPSAMATGIEGPVAALNAAFERAAIEETRRLCETLPADDLAIQWDVCVETIAEEARRAPQRVRESSRRPLDRSSFEAAMASCARVCDAVPRNVPLGVHFCYGDPDGRPVVVPQDASVLRDLANYLAASVQRRIDWIHMPVPADRDDEVFFAPLGGLRLHPRTRIYLGLIHALDGVEGARRRIAAARRVLPQFGVATPCGMGRMDPVIIPALLDLHRDVARLV